MAKRILYIAIAACVLGLIWYGYSRHAADLAMDNGNVVSRDTPSSSKARLDSGAVDLDGRPMADGASGYTSSTGSTAATGRSTPSPMVPTATVPATPAAVPSNIEASLPATDTLSPNAPNGMAFGGSGKYQWYRQGNLTWRINTQSGSSCIAFATMEEWQKPLVYSHGCGNA